MKNSLKGILRVVCLLFINIYFAQNTEKQEFKVKGSCGMCKARIEKTAKNAGANSAVWNIETQTLTLETDQNKSSFDQILKEIANAGHDNEKHKAPDNVYENLPGCCLYDRESDYSEMKPHSEMHEMEHSETKEHSIKEISLVSHKQATSVSKKEVGLTFNISGKELLKAACCNLSESFETNATVDVSFNNAVTGSKQLRMLGLDQKYTALTKEQLPEIRGLSSAYGLNFIPGRWIGGIQLTKGGSTVVNGYESITGQINTELVKAEQEDKSSINIFVDFDNRQEANIVHTDQINEHWNQSILLHGNTTWGKMDYNKDGFLDRPRGHQLNASYLANYVDLDHTGWASHSGINFLLDKRVAGQVDFNEHFPQNQQSAYGVGINLSHFQIWNKTGHIFKGKPYQSIGLMNRLTFHKQDSFFGLRNYFGEQKTLYSNLVFESIFGNTNHKYKTGASLLYDHYHEMFSSDHYMREEFVPGIFFEYTLTGEKYVLVAGIRTDFHNLAGTQFTPRLNFKYDITPKTILRISAGKGFRTANIFAENQQYFTSSREVEIINSNGKIYGLKPEIAWNYGVNLQQEFRLFNKKSSILVDFFRTDFTNQVLTDLDVSAQKLVFYNLNGKSFANSFQTQWDIQPVKNFDVRLAYKYYDVQADFLSGRKEVPFIAKHRAFVNLAYSTPKTEKGRFWAFDATVNWIGKQRLPQMSDNPKEFQLPHHSKPYITMNAQISRNFSKNIRVYAGAENLTNTIQENAIIDAKNPFSNYFDAGMIYAPIMPINVYIGVDIDL
ncbi:MAG: TonB-dependent receptor [Flavobacteriaceae bacterium]|nr:TonB-dependent receptor [Flavobacteriaceae bacterium]